MDDPELRLDPVIVTYTRPSAVAKSPTPATARFQDEDRRAKLIVPPQYVDPSSHCAGPRKNNSGEGMLTQARGIIFPYTPTIDLTHTANYQSQSVIHSNYAQYYYKGSEVSRISLSAIFTVQNLYEAEVLIAVQHLGRALTKMPFGKDQWPLRSGSPPPVCRLYAHGDYMLDYVPVAVSSFKMAMPNDVNYFTTDETSMYGITSVPMKTTITMELVPIYSRREMLESSVSEWISGEQRIKGYL